MNHGNWGYGLFEGSTEDDIATDYLRRRRRGLSPEAAAQKVYDFCLAQKPSRRSAYDRVNRETHLSFAQAKLARWRDLQALYLVTLAAIQIVRHELTPAWCALARQAIEAARIGDRLLWALSTENVVPAPEVAIDPARQGVISSFYELLRTFDNTQPFTPETLPPYLAGGEVSET
jgi:hypothetical protein